MKYLIYSDIHISQGSSIVKQEGIKYSIRLEHIIDSINWAEDLAEKENCSAVFNLGDTFDKPIINSMEATAVQDIRWNNLPHYILVGNHDSDVASLEYSSVNVLKKLGFEIIAQPKTIMLNNDKFVFIPYITENNRKEFNYYVQDKDSIVLSHNDVSGFNFGGFLSKDGFAIADIEKDCKLFLNGHLHNSSFLSKKVLNVGNLCGQNFSEDAFKYSHGCWILDTDNMSLQFFENPHSFNFYQIEYPNDVEKLSRLKDNSVINIKCERSQKSLLEQDLLRISNKIIAKRIIVFDKEVESDENEIIKLEKVDHLKQLKDYIIDTLGNTEIVQKELKEICK